MITKKFIRTKSGIIINIAISIKANFLTLIILS